jgi:8-oxo-dGTP pyrophosphatase MutT (NUDIX family)
MNEMLITPISLALIYAFDQKGERHLFWQERKSGFWELVGGKIEKNESPLDAIIREKNEEAPVIELKSEFKLFGIYPHTFENQTLLLHVFYALGKLEQMNFSLCDDVKTFDSTLSVIEDFRRTRL